MLKRKVLKKNIEDHLHSKGNGRIWIDLEGNKKGGLDWYYKGYNSLSRFQLSLIVKLCNKFIFYDTMYGEKEAKEILRKEHKELIDGFGESLGCDIDGDPRW